MKKFRKGLACLLAAIMVLAALPAGALAAEGDETPVCTCETVCTEGSVNTDCPVCGLEDADLSQCKGTAELASPSNATALSVEDVQKLIDALPTVDELKAMTQEEQGPVYAALQDAYDAYDALTDAEKLEVTGAEIMDALFDVFNEMTEPLTDTGAFSVEGDSSSYSYSDGVLTVRNGAHLTISMTEDATTSTSDRIVVAQNATASITLVNVNISAPNAKSAIDVSSGSSLTLTLASNTDNILKGGDGRNTDTGAAPGIHVPENATLAVLCESADDSGKHICDSAGNDCGKLTVTGGSCSTGAGGVGIGGGPPVSSGTGDAGQSCGTVLLLGGDILVTGGTSSSTSATMDIGGSVGGLSSGTGGLVIILTSVKSSSGTLHVGGGAQPGGNADNGAGIKPSTGDNTYEVYGVLLLPDNLTIPAGVTVTIPENTTLTVQFGKTLTNDGTIVNNGTITVNSGGTLTNNGDVSGSGSLTNNGTVTKKQQIATAPTADDVTAAETSITVKTVAGQKYAYTASDTAPGTTDNCWQTATGSTMTFDSLSAGKTYYIWTYKPGNDYYADSDVVGTEINTVPSAPAASDVTINYKEETITFGDTLEVNTSENFDGTSIANNGSITDYIKDTENTIYVRVKGTSDTAASAATPVTILARPTAPTTVQGGYEKLTGVTAEMQYSTDGTNWTDITGTEVTGLTSGSYYVRYKATDKDFASYATNAVTVQADETLPTGTITVNENSWKSFINTITFGIFCKDKYDVTITATDVGTGVKSIQYYLSDTALTLDDVKSLADGQWTDYPENGFSITDDGKYIVYTKITDNSGNVAYLSTDGMILDKEAPSKPTVSGYTSDTWTNQNVTLTVSDSYALSGIARYEYSTDNGVSWNTITATEQTANPANVVKAQLTISGATETAYLLRAVSNSEMEGESATVTVKLDKTQPDIVVTGDTESYLQNDTVEITATAGLSGVTKVEVNGMDITGSYADGYTVTENGTYTFTVTNGAGVSDSTTITYDKLDRIQPIVEVDTNGYTSGEWTNENVTLSVANTAANLGTTAFEYKTDDGGWQSCTGTITVFAETSGTTYTFRATSASGMVSKEVSVTVKIDKTAPDGDIKIEENSVKTFINAITFSLFFNENVDVTISAEDSGSGVKSVEYYRSEEILTEEQAAAITDWTVYGSAISETAEDAETFIYYVKITDNAGNVTCFASNGAVFDLTAPVISGVTDGGTYYTTQKVTVDDTNIDSVTVNGEAAGAEITLAGNTDITYTIIATDKAGNETAVTVTMKRTESISEEIDGITPDNVTSNDRDKIEEYLEDLNERLEDENLTDEEKEIIDSLIDKAEDLLEKLEEAEQAGNTDAIDKVQDITPDNVTPEDKEDLEQAKEDIESALENYGDHYTDEEKAQLEEALERIEAALEVIERIEEVEAAIEALPDSVVPSDTETAERINAAKDLYDDLTDYEQSLISDGAKEKLEDLLAQLGDYRITDGDGSTWTKGSGEDLTITANGASDKLVRVEIDGETLSSEYYTVTGENTVITISADYLETLAADGHTITVIYTDGEAAGTFAVAEQQAEPSDDDTTADDTTSTGVDNTDTSTTSPQTGDDSNIALWIAIMLAAGVALAGTILYSRKRKHSR